MKSSAMPRLWSQLVWKQLLKLPSHPWRWFPSSPGIQMCGNHIPASLRNRKCPVSGQTAQLPNFQNIFTPISKKAGSESQMERENPGQSCSLSKKSAECRMENLLIKHCIPERFHSLSCPIKDSRESNGVFRGSAQAHLCEISRNTQIPGPASALSLPALLMGYFCACQDPQVMANKEGLWVWTGLGNALFALLIWSNPWNMRGFHCYSWLAKPSLRAALWDWAELHIHQILYQLPWSPWLYVIASDFKENYD